MQDIRTVANRIIDNVATVIVGKRDAIELVVVAMLSDGHILIEDVPGVGKTTLAKAISRSVGLSFKRVQFTPDLLPSDVTGVTIFNQKTREFEFREGPVMAQIVLADEVNRATPKTQSALLEAMEERQITVDGTTYTLPEPFLVLATQNPIEYEGTFPLPEAQLDRFLMRVNLGYPDRGDELQVLATQQRERPIDDIQQVVTLEEVFAAQEAVKGRVRGPAGVELHRRHQPRDARTQRRVPGRQSARQPGPVSRRAGDGGGGGARLCGSGRREAAGGVGAVAPGDRESGRPHSQRGHASHRGGHSRLRSGAWRVQPPDRWRARSRRLPWSPAASSRGTGAGWRRPRLAW